MRCAGVPTPRRSGRRTNSFFSRRFDGAQRLRPNGHDHSGRQHVAACDRAPTDNSPNASFNSPRASFARGGNGGGKGQGTTLDQPQMGISPTQLSLAVGQQATVAVTYWEARQHRPGDDKSTYFNVTQHVSSGVPLGTPNRAPWLKRVRLGPSYMRERCRSVRMSDAA